jgi:hypothetical protein
MARKLADLACAKSSTFLDKPLPTEHSPSLEGFGVGFHFGLNYPT